MSLYKRLLNWLSRDDKDEEYTISFNYEMPMISQQIRNAELKHKPGIWIKQPSADVISELRARGYEVVDDRREGQVYIWWGTWL